MKQLISLLLTLIVLLCCAGCSPAPIPPEPDPEPTPEPAPVTQEAQEPQKEPFVFTRENFPYLDGSTSTVPLAQAIASILLSETQEQVEDLTRFNRTSNSYQGLIWQPRWYVSGGNEQYKLLLAAEPPDSVWEMKQEAQFEWDMEPFAIDGLIFVVNADNPVDSLTVEQVQKIYTGEITNWKQVGGDDVEIIPFQRNEEAGSQTMMKKLVMGELPMLEPTKDYMRDSMFGLLEAVKAYDGSNGAIGYSVYYYANDMRMAEGLKILKINGVEPGAESFRDKSYPFTNPYCVVKAAEALEDDPATILFDWILSEEGQRLAEEMGYVPIHDPEASPPQNRGNYAVKTNWAMLQKPEKPEESQVIYKQYWPEPQQKLIPHDSYGRLISFVGAEVSPNYGYPFYLFGLATTNGEVVVEPIYVDVRSFDWNGTHLPVYALYQVEITERALLENDPYLGADDSDDRITLIAEDGRWKTSQEFRFADVVSKDKIFLIDLEGNPWLCDTEGNLTPGPIEEPEEKEYVVDSDGTLRVRDADGNLRIPDDRTPGELLLGELRSEHHNYEFHADISDLHISDTILQWLTRETSSNSFMTQPQDDGELSYSGDDEVRIVFNDGWVGLVDKDGNWLLHIPLRNNDD